MRQRNPRGKGGQLRGELIEAAMRILDQAPAKELTLRMVAREAGITAPSIYPHFADAQMLISAIVRDCWRQVADAMETADVAPSEPLVALKSEMVAFVRYAMERPSRYQLLFAAQPIDPDEDRGREGHLQPVYRRVRSAILACAGEGLTFVEPDLTAATLHVIALAHGRIALAHLAPRLPGNSSEAVQTFVSTQLDALFGQGSSNGTPFQPISS